MKTKIILIHGIGTQVPGEAQSAVQKILSENTDFSEIDVEEFFWSCNKKSFYDENKDNESIFGFNLGRKIRSIKNAASVYANRQVYHKDFLSASQNLIVCGILIIDSILLLLTASLLLDWALQLSLSYWVITIFLAVCVLHLVFAMQSGFGFFCALRQIVLSFCYPLVVLMQYIVFIIPILLFILFCFYYHLITDYFFPGVLDLKYVVEESRNWFFPALRALLLMVFILLSAKIFFGCIFLFSWLSITLTPYIKLFEDIFYYLGDENWRKGLVNELQERLFKSEKCGYEQIILAGHSLGSIIAIDALRQISYNKHSNQKLEETNVTLVTGGSPLKRFFQMFFKKFYPSTTILIQQILRNYPKFKWVNVYRYHDPVGASVGLPSELEVSSDTVKGKLACSWWTAHLGYWSDVDVFKVLVPKLQLKHNHFSPNDTHNTPPIFEPDTKNFEFLDRWRSNLLIMVASLCFVILSLGYFSNLFSVRYLEDEEHAKYFSNSAFTSAPGKLFRYTVQTLLPKTGIVNSYKFCGLLSKKDDPEQLCRNITLGRGGTKCLSQFVRNQNRKKIIIRPNVRNIEMMGHWSSVKFVYSSKNPTLIAVQDCLPSASTMWYNKIGDWLKAILLWLFPTLLFLTVYSVFVYFVVRPFIGVVKS